MNYLKEEFRTILFTIVTTTTKIEYSETNLTKEVKDLYLENYKITKERN